MRLSRSVCIAAFAASAFVAVHAQDAPPLTPAAAAERFADCVDRLDTADGRHALAELAQALRSTLGTPTGAPALRQWAIDTVLPALRARFTRRQGLGHGAAQHGVTGLYVALRDPAATTDTLAALAHDLAGPRELLRLCPAVAALPLDGAQDDAFYAAIRDAVRRYPRDLDRLLPAIERRPGERWLRLLTDSALPAVGQLQPDGPRLVWAIARSLGGFWDGPPHLRHRVPALLKLVAVRDADVQAAAIEGLERLAFQRVRNPARFRAVWSTFAKKLTGADDATLAIGLLRDRLAEAQAGGDVAGLANDLAQRLPALGRPGSTWATPVLLDVFGWDGAALAPARGAAIVALRRTGDPAAVAPLVALVSATLADDRAQADAIAAIGALAGDPVDDDADIESILRRSLREGRPLPRRAAAVALGQLRMAGALDELSTFGDAASGADAAEAWKAVARIGTGRAADALLARCEPGDLASCEPVVRALGSWAALPVPDALAERLGVLWDVAWGRPALTPGQREGLREALGAAALGGPLDADAPRFRGCVHPGLLPRLRALALALDAAAAPHARLLCERLAAEGTADDAWPVLRDVLAGRPDAERAGIALQYIVAHPDATRRADYVSLLANDVQPPAVRIALLALLGRPGIWDDAACWPALAAQLRAGTAGEWDLLVAAVGIARDHPSVAHAPDVIALLPQAPGDDPDAAIQVGGVLWHWGQRAVGVAWPEIPNARGPWQRWWGRNRAMVTFR